MTSTTTQTTQFTSSADGTRIAYEVTGSGPAIVLVDGALCSRRFGPARRLAQELKEGFTVFTYDRRGRGESGVGTSTWSVDREIEDLEAVIEAARGKAHVFGLSSGGALSLEAARRGLSFGRLALYEVPFIVDETHAPNDPLLPKRMQALVDDGRRGSAVRLFMRTVGVPGPMLTVMPLMPAWKRLKQVAHTLPYDLSIVIDRQQGRPLPTGYFDPVAPDTLVLAGGKSPEYMRNAQAAIADAVPHGSVQTLPGQTHMVKPKVVAPVVTSFLGG